MRKMRKMMISAWQNLFQLAAGAWLWVWVKGGVKTIIVKSKTRSRSGQHRVLTGSRPRESETESTSSLNRVEAKRKWRLSQDAFRGQDFTSTSWLHLCIALMMIPFSRRRNYYSFLKLRGKKKTTRTFFFFFTNSRRD